MDTMADNSIRHTRTTVVKMITITMRNITGTNLEISELPNKLKNKKMYMLATSKIKKRRKGTDEVDYIYLYALAQLQDWA
jgi:hypothetical protein